MNSSASTTSASGIGITFSSKLRRIATRLVPKKHMKLRNFCAPSSLHKSK